MESKSFGLSLLQVYSDGSESESDSNPTIPQTIDASEVVDTKVEEVTPTPDESSNQLVDLMQKPVEFPNFYRESTNISDSESESSSDESRVTSVATPIRLDVETLSGDEDENDSLVEKNRALNSKSKMLEDLGIFDLAPLEDLKITVPEEECIPIGVVHNIIDPLVIVSAKKGCPAIDLDSVLFLDHGKTFLGQVFDVFGQVSEPMYMIRFNSMQHIIDQGVQVGMEVYFAPRTRHTAFVFVDALFKQKGSDASWENDQEPPEGCLDYSDDEQERRAKAAHRLKKNPRNSNEEVVANPSKKRHTKSRRSRSQYQEHLLQQTAVNPFYMLPPPGYPPFNPSSGLSVPNNSITLTSGNPGISNVEQSPSSYVYPPPPCGDSNSSQNSSFQPDKLG